MESDSDHPILTKAKVQEFAKRHFGDKLIAVLDVQDEAGSEVGSNYSGSLIALRVKVSLRDQGEQRVHWMVKLPPPDPQRLVLNKAMMLDFKEIRFYSFLAPEFEKLLKERNASVKFNFCPCVYTELQDPDSKEPSILVMQNLKHLGYKDAINRKKGLSLDYCRVVLYELAKFHAVSYVYFRSKMSKEGTFKDKDFQIYVRDYVFTDKPDIAKQATDAMVKPITMIQESFLIGCQEEGEDFGKAFERLLKKYGDNVMDAPANFVRCDPNDFNVLCHGDAWFGNTLFKHDENDKPVEGVLLDNANYKWANPCSDLAYFFFNSTTAEMRSQHIDQLLDHYHVAFSSTLESMGEKSDAYPLETFKDDYNRFCVFGFLASCIVLPGALCRKEDAFTPDDLATDWSDPKEIEKMQERLVKKAKIAFENEPHFKVMMRGNFMELVHRNHIQL